MELQPKIWLYRFLYFGLRLYWKIFSPKSESAICIVEYDGKVLLARNTYGDRKWVFPGGGCQKGETAENSAHREVSEEVGINLEKLTSFGIYKNSSVNKNALVHCFHAQTNSPTFQIDKTEIGEAAWFEWEHLPQPISIDAARIIEMFKSKDK
jgi:8-oxo-dGTP pyrophosphatase MutT (NUDIX family)